MSSSAAVRGYNTASKASQAFAIDVLTFAVMSNHGAGDWVGRFGQLFQKTTVRSSLNQEGGTRGPRGGLPQREPPILSFMPEASVTRLRFVGFLEGLSWLALIVAMVIKRIYDEPGAIRIPGMVHGVFFVAYCAAIIQVMLVRRWPIGRGLALFTASLLPFGTFIMDSRIKRWAGGS